MIGDIGWACIIIMAIWIILLLLLQKTQNSNNYYKGKSDGEKELISHFKWAIEHNNKISTEPIFIFSHGNPVSLSNLHCFAFGNEPAIWIDKEI